MLKKAIQIETENNKKHEEELKSELEKKFNEKI